MQLVECFSREPLIRLSPESRSAGEDPTEDINLRGADPPQTRHQLQRHLRTA